METVKDVNYISEELCRFLQSNILAPGVGVQPDTVLTNIGVDSFSVIEIILFIERRFGVILPDEYLVPENLKTVEALARCTHRQLESGGA